MTLCDAMQLGYIILSNSKYCFQLQIFHSRNNFRFFSVILLSEYKNNKEIMVYFIGFHKWMIINKILQRVESTVFSIMISRWQQHLRLIDDPLFYILVEYETFWKVKYLSYTSFWVQLSTRASERINLFYYIKSSTEVLHYPT